jgi:hypothetical protein
LNVRVYSISDVSQIEIHTAEKSVPGRLEVEIVTGKFKKYKLPSSDQILAELKQEVKHYYLEIHKLINAIWSKEELTDEWKGSIIVTILKKI